MTKVLFAGTPDVAVPALETLADRFDVVGVLTRPDAPSGRGKTLTPSPVKITAQKLGIPVLEGKPGSAEVLKFIADSGVEIAAVVAYGELLRQPVLDAVPLGWFNLHFSLLPAWRGAAPVQRAIWAGDAQTGVTIFKIDAGLDTGRIVSQSAVEIGPKETSGDLLDRLAVMGAPRLADAIESVAKGSAQFAVQPALLDDSRKYAKKITADDAHIDFGATAVEIIRQVRACSPEPSAWAALADNANSAVKRFHIDEVALADSADVQAASALQYANDVPATEEARVGQIVASKKHVWVRASDGFVEIVRITPPGKKTMTAADWARGARLEAGARFE
jgi:methionyl-tRNA formyltransferase